VIESRTAALLEPYLNQGKNAGELNWSPEKLNPFVEALDREKFQIHIHAIGDRGIRVALDALEAAQKKNGVRDWRPLMAHIELIDPQDVPRFAKLNVIPNFQPLWAYEDEYIKDLTVPQLGKERSRWLYPIKSVETKGARLAMGSDWPVSSVNPLDGIEVAVRRSDFNESKDDPFIPEERISLESALAAYTLGSAYANFREKEVGSIEKGKLADLIVLSQNLFEIPAHQINDTKVLLTLFEGKEVYRGQL
jgi:predicted amidohydrolase YtcJ